MEGVGVVHGPNSRCAVELILCSLRQSIIGQRHSRSSNANSPGESIEESGSAVTVNCAVRTLVRFDGEGGGVRGLDSGRAVQEGPRGQHRVSCPSFQNKNLPGKQVSRFPSLFSFLPPLLLVFQP